MAQEPIRVLFLDFDGVLNYLTSPDRDGVCLGLNEDRVKLVSDFVQKEDLKVVISSFWRYSHPLSGLKILLTRKGWADVERIIGTTDVSPMGADRGQEVDTWLAEHPEAEAYVILDDNPVAGHRNKLVQTNIAAGVTPACIDRAKEILDRQPRSGVQ